LKALKGVGKKALKGAEYKGEKGRVNLQHLNKKRKKKE